VYVAICVFVIHILTDVTSLATRRH